METITLPKIGEHIVFCGTTGSGKTFLAKRMLENYPRVFLFDTQNSLMLKDSTKITTPHNLRKKLKAFDRIRYVPDLEYRNKSDYNKVIKELFNSPYSQNRVIYIDEIFHLGYGMSFPDWLSRGISTARQKKISLWTSSQRPMNIPMAILTESRRIYLFYLSYADDLKKIAKFTREEKEFMEAIKNLGYDYSFIELDRIKGSWKKYPKLKKEDTIQCKKEM